MANNISKRSFGFGKTDMPLTSKRVRIILSNPESAKNLSDAVRELRRGDQRSVSFEVTQETFQRLKDAANN